MLASSLLNLLYHALSSGSESRQHLMEDVLQCCTQRCLGSLGKCQFMPFDRHRLGLKNESKSGAGSPLGAMISLQHPQHAMIKSKKITGYFFFSWNYSVIFLTSTVRIFSLRTVQTTRNYCNGTASAHTARLYGTTLFDVTSETSATSVHGCRKKFSLH